MDFNFILIFKYNVYYNNNEKNTIFKWQNLLVNDILNALFHKLCSCKIVLLKY